MSIIEKIDVEHLKSQLDGCVLGQKIVHRLKVDSTNDLAKRLAQEGAIEGTVIIADEQIKGRGRLGRIWYSPSGVGLWFSTILRPNLIYKNGGALSLLPAVAIAQTIDRLFSIKPELKWPNDVLLCYKKVAGILSESHCTGEVINFLVLGAGVNLTQAQHDFPADLRETATSLFQETGRLISRTDVLVKILIRMDAIYQTVRREGIQKLIEEWKQYAVGFGERVLISAGEEQVLGVMENITSDGSAILRLDDGQVKVLATGDCTIVKRDSYVIDG